MNIRRILSYLAVALLATFLWSAWVKEHPQEASAPQATQGNAVADSQQDGSSEFVPDTFNPTAAKQQEERHEKPSDPLIHNLTGKTVNVKTDVLDVSIDLATGSIASARLPKYSLSIKDKTPITILNNNTATPYYSQSGLTNIKKLQYSAVQNTYIMQPDEKTLTVELTTNTENNLHLTKTFTFTRGDYAIKMDYLVKNHGSEAWSGSLYTQFIRHQPEKQGHRFYARSYDGASISSPSIPYEKITYKAMDEKNLDRTINGGWAAMQQHYFLSAWIPEKQRQMNYFYSRVNNNGIYTLGFTSPQVTVLPGKQQQVKATLYIGPEIAHSLKKLAPNLERTIDYGWLFWVSIVLFWLMNMVHFLVGNWGWSIVITTIIIKFILYPLSATSFRSMARMRELQPKMKQLKERYADDRQAMSRATMELYRKEKINPLGGCLPMLIQIPIFIGLYYVIIESVQLRQAPFIFWIHDLAIKDPYYVLPILMGVSMLIQQKLSPSSPDPAQARIMMFIPVVFTVFFVNFPAGLTLYWLVNNVVQIAQQYYVGKTFDAHQAKKNHKARQRKKSKSFRFK